MDNKKKTFIITGIGVGVALLLFVAIAIFGMFRGFNSEKYVSAVLNQTFKGEVDAVAKMTKDSNPADLRAQYEKGITSFAMNSLAGGVEMEADLKGKYISLCKEIFADMKYTVVDHKKTSSQSYDVTVEYEPTDIINRFATSMTNVNTTLTNRVENGDYRGTREEINEQMKKDFLKEVYPFYEADYANMEYGEKQTIVFRVEKGENGLYKMDSQAVTEFIKKILGSE